MSGVASDERADELSPQFSLAEPGARPLAAIISAIPARLKGLFVREETSPIDASNQAISSAEVSLPSETWLTTLVSAIELPQTIDELVSLGLDAQIGNELRQLVTAGNSEAQVVAAFLYALSRSAISAVLDRRFKRAVHKRWKEVSPDSDLDAVMEMRLAGDETHRMPV